MKLEHVLPEARKFSKITKSQPREALVGQNWDRLNIKKNKESIETKNKTKQIYGYHRGKWREGQIRNLGLTNTHYYI